MTLLLTNSISKAIAAALLKERPVEKEYNAEGHTPLLISLNQWKRDVLSVAIGLSQANPKFDQSDFLKAAGFPIKRNLAAEVAVGHNTSVPKKGKK